MENGQVRRGAHRRHHPTHPATNYPNRLWYHRNKCERILITIITLIAVLLFVLLVMILVANQDGICNSATCVRASMDLLAHMDPQADPCQDFYQFACGTFMQNIHLGGRHSFSVKHWSQAQVDEKIRFLLEKLDRQHDAETPVQMAQKLYHACTQNLPGRGEGFERFRQIVRHLGGWPMLEGPTWYRNHFSWNNSFINMRKIGIVVPGMWRLRVHQAAGWPHRPVLVIDTEHFDAKDDWILDRFPIDTIVLNNSKSVLLEYMVELAMMFGAPRERARRDQFEVVQFIEALAQMAERAEHMNETANFYNSMSLSELDRSVPGLGWSEFINNFLAPAAHITYDDLVLVPRPRLVRGLLTLLNGTDKRIVANFMAWQTLQHLIDYLPTEIADKAHEYYQKLNGKHSNRRPRWMVCVRTAKERLGAAVAAAYIKEYFPYHVRQRVIAMILEIKKNLIESVERIQWLDNNTKKMAREKLLTNVVDIPSYTEQLQISRVYEQTDVIEDDLLTSVLNLDYLNVNIEYGRLMDAHTNELLSDGSSDSRSIDRNPTDDVRHSDFVTGLNIIFDPTANVLKIPVGVFQGFYYQDNRPEYMNYGALGSIIAHEISHIIIEAKYRDLQGELRSWWSPHSLLRYEEKLRCISKHYSSFTLPQIQHQSTHQMDRDMTRNEDFLDLMGMKVVYDTYQEWASTNGGESRLPGIPYSSNQLFWISSAMHQCAKQSARNLLRYISNYRTSPAMFRVNGPLQNIEQFARDFGCPAGAPMNPENKCHVI